MPATVKMFVADRLAMLPQKWMEAVGNTHHASQGTLVIMSLTKKDVVALLTDRGLGQREAEALARGARKVAHVPIPQQMLLDAGVIDPNAVDVYVYRDAVKDRAIARIDRCGNVEVVAHFRYESSWDGRGLWVEPLNA